MVAGSTGSGKSTLARTLSTRLHLPYVELDSLFHGPGWVPRETFVAEVTAFAAGDRWVTEWQYDEARPLLLARADTLIWLDYPRSTIMRRVLVRSFRRAAFRQRLFNGNTEGFSAWLDAEHPVRWAWHGRRRAADQLTAALPGRPDLAVVRLTSPGDTKRWLAGLIW